MLGAISFTRFGKAFVLVASACAVRRAFDRRQQRKPPLAANLEEPEFAETQPATHELSMDEWLHVAGGTSSSQDR